MSVGDITFELPEGWRLGQRTGPFSVFAHPEAWSDGFIPNFTVLVTETVPGLSPEAYLAHQLEVSVDLVDPLLLDTTVDRRAARVGFVIAHAVNGFDVTTTQRHLLTPEGAVVAAAVTVADRDWPSLAADMLALVESVELPT